MGRIGGNSSGPGGPTGADGINWEGNESSDEFGFDRQPNKSYGPSDLGSINAKGNRGGLARDYGYSKQKTILDRPVMASRARAKASSAVEDDSGFPYGGPSSRQEK